MKVWVQFCHAARGVGSGTEVPRWLKPALQLGMLLLIGTVSLWAANDGDGTTPLHVASHENDVQMATQLIRAGANVNAETDLGVTPLWLACEIGSSPMVRLLLEAGADPNRALLRGETPLMAAAKAGNADVVERLLSKGANPNARATRGQTALMWAVSQRRLDAARALVAHGADVHARSETWSQMMAVPPHGYPEYNRMIPHGGNTALLFAARVGDLEAARILVAAGANVNDADAWGVSATVLAAHSGFREMVEFFLAKGADPNASGAGFAALHEAIMRRDEAMVAALLARGANANAKLRTWTPTRRSSKDFHFEPGMVGASPLWMAARFQEPGIVKLLIKHGADAKVVHVSEVVVEKGGYEKKKSSASALEAALGKGTGSAWVDAVGDRAAARYETVRVLVENGAEVSAKAVEAGRSLGDARVAELLVGRQQAGSAK
ncbi:MAG: ankyrin repeat domain-containing protein [Bryobacteraceae bacterium]